MNTQQAILLVIVAALAALLGWWFAQLFAAVPATPSEGVGTPTAPTLTVRLPEVYALPGEVVAVGEDAITVRVINPDLALTPELSERIITLSDDVVIDAEGARKDSEVYDAEFQAFMELVQELEVTTEGEERLATMTAPSIYETVSSSRTSLVTGSRVVIFVQGDIRNEKTFPAERILIMSSETL